MKASLRSARIAPKKANIIAKMVRGKTVSEAIVSLERTNKKAARMIEKLVQSAVANAAHNDKQSTDGLVIKTIVVQQGQAYHRGYPMARGRMRHIRKFLTHIDLTLGVAAGTPESQPKGGKKEEKEKSVKKATGTESSAKASTKASTKTSSAVQKKGKAVSKASASKSSKGKSAKDTTASNSLSAVVSENGTKTSVEKADAPAKST